MLRNAVFLIFIASVLSGIGCHPVYAESPEEAEIRALIDRWTKAAQKKNVDGVMSIYQRGPSLVAYDLVPPLQYKGWDAYRTDYEKFFSQYDGPIKFEFRDLLIAAAETLGYSHELQRVSGIMKGGQKSEFLVTGDPGLPQDRRPVARDSRTRIRADLPGDGQGGARPHALNGKGGFRKSDGGDPVRQARVGRCGGICDGAEVISFPVEVRSP